MIPLLTERLRLRALTLDDLDFVRRLHANPDLVRFIPSAITPDEATARRHLEYFMSLADHPVQGFSLIELRGADDDGRAVAGTAVGLIMIKPIPPSGGGEATVLEIGWHWCGVRAARLPSASCWLTASSLPVRKTAAWSTRSFEF